MAVVAFRIHEIAIEELEKYANLLRRKSESRPWQITVVERPWHYSRLARVSRSRASESLNLLAMTSQIGGSFRMNSLKLSREPG